jgi:hypothetical protein
VQDGQEGEGVIGEDLLVRAWEGAV